jgi:hypothetical protein
MNFHVRSWIFVLNFPPNYIQEARLISSHAWILHVVISCNFAHNSSSFFTCSQTRTRTRTRTRTITCTQIYLPRQEVHSRNTLKDSLMPPKSCMLCATFSLGILRKFKIICWGPGSSVSIATAYELDGQGSESRWGRDFPHLSRPALRPTQPPVKLVPGLSRG